MAVVVRYFSTAAAGTGDGTSWANRAKFDPSGAHSSIIKNFNFAGSDALECRIGPGTYTISENLNGGQFSVAAPTRANQLFLVGADSSGERLTPPDPDWCAAEPVWDTSGMPLINTSGEIQIADVGLYMLRVVSSNVDGVSDANITASWCYLEGTATGSGDSVCAGYLSDCVVRASGAAYATVVLLATNNTITNVRAEGNPSATTGTRHGFGTSGNGQTGASKCVAVDNPGDGFSRDGDGNQKVLYAFNCLAYGNDGDGFSANSTNVSLSAVHRIINCVAVGNGGYGISVGTPPAFVRGGRFRDNTSGTLDGVGNGFVNDLIQTAGTDAAEFVDAAGGDFRIKNTSSIWGLGIGAGDEPPAGGGGTRGYWG